MSTKKKSRKNAKGAACARDVILGNLIRQRRIQLGLSQESLADSIGVSFQQVQKYERGTNRITISTLYRITKALKDDAASYIRKIDNLLESAPSAYIGLSDNEQAPFISERVAPESETAELLRAFYSIENAEKRRKILKIVGGLASKRGTSRTKSS